MKSIVMPRKTSSEVRRADVTWKLGAGIEATAPAGRVAASIMTPGC